MGKHERTQCRQKIHKERKTEQFPEQFLLRSNNRSRNKGRTYKLDALSDEAPWRQCRPKTIMGCQIHVAQKYEPSYFGKQVITSTLLARPHEVAILVSPKLYPSRDSSARDASDRRSEGLRFNAGFRHFLMKVAGGFIKINGTTTGGVSNSAKPMTGL